MMHKEMQDDEHKKRQLRRRMRIMLVCLVVLFGGIFLYKMAMGMLMRHFACGDGFHDESNFFRLATQDY
jgi:hypothetical protein